MAKKKEPVSTKRPSLSVKRVEASQLLDEQIKKGLILKQNPIGSPEELERERAEYYKWNSFNEELLRKIFDNDSIANEYRGISFGAFGGNPFHTDLKYHKEDIQYNLDKLDSIKERLPLFDELNTSTPENTSAYGSSAVNNTNIFIVHGHDEIVKIHVARTLEKLGMKPIILHERPNVGQTIIEKLESNSDVGFAVVLLTPDDEGKEKNAESLNKRARQNVIAELGFFIGKLGRKKVCAIYVEGVEVPSDFNGVLYVFYDQAGSWRFELLRELKSAGYTVDANKLLD